MSSRRTSRSWAKNITRSRTCRTSGLSIERAAYSIPWAADVMKRAGSLDTDALIKAWEGAGFKTAWGDVEMHACDHQM